MLVPIDPWFGVFSGIPITKHVYSTVRGSEPFARMAAFPWVPQASRRNRVNGDQELAAKMHRKPGSVKIALTKSRFRSSND
jgi:hypothetical protein